MKTRKFDISVAALVWLNFKGLSVSLGERWVQGGKKSHCTGQGGLFLKCKSSHIQRLYNFFCPTTFTFFKAGKYVGSRLNIKTQYILSFSFSTF